MGQVHELKDGSMAVISPLNATATAAAVRDEKGHACMMLTGGSAEILTLIENMAVQTIMGIFRNVYEEDGEDKALDALIKSGKLLTAHVMERLLAESMKDKIKRECGNMPDELADILAKAVRDFADKDDDDEEKEEGED